MKNHLLFLTLLLITLGNGLCFGQDSSACRDIFPSGIEIQIGTGDYACRDEYLSGEKYTGSASGFALQWSRYHETYGYRLGVYYQHAPAIKNYTVSSEVALGGMEVMNLYPAGAFALFGKRVFVMLGPSVDFFFYDRRQDIARNPSNDFNPDHSDFWLMSLCGTAEAVLPIREQVQVDCGLLLGLVSVGAGTSRINGSTSSPKLLTVFRSLVGRAEIGVRYFPIESISVRAGYALKLLRVDSWDYLLSGSDNAVVTVGFHF